MRRCSLTLAVVTASLLLCLFTPRALAYNVRYTYKSHPTGLIDLQRAGYCDEGTFSFMPITEAFNTRATETLSKNGGSLAPMGGFSRKSICLDERCTWQYYKGLFHLNEMTFYYGVHYNGVAKVKAEDGYYNNWEASYPVEWKNVSYFGKRQVALQSSGTWINVETVTYFKDWVCEAYEYQKSDHVFFPTWVNGDVILPTQPGASTLSHCGKVISRDSQGRWLDVKCKSEFPWWAALIIAVIGLIVLVAIIIIIWCCCCVCDRRDEEKKRNEMLESTRDNPSNIPYQSELGMSRNSSSRMVDTEEDEDERSFSRSNEV